MGTNDRSILTMWTIKWRCDGTPRTSMSGSQDGSSLMKMSCRDFSDFLMGYLDGELPEGQRAVFETPNGQAKYFVASDHIESPSYRALEPVDLFDVAVKNGLHYDHTRQTGVVFHMLASPSGCGRLGMTAVADSPDGAKELYDRTRRILDREAERALRPRKL